MKLDLSREQQLIPSCRRSNRDGARKLSGADLDVSTAPWS